VNSIYIVLKVDNEVIGAYTERAVAELVADQLHGEMYGDRAEQASSMYHVYECELNKLPLKTGL
jgi:hypothetical protein